MAWKYLNLNLTDVWILINLSYFVLTQCKIGSGKLKAIHFILLDFRSLHTMLEISYTHGRISNLDSAIKIIPKDFQGFFTG